MRRLSTIALVVLGTAAVVAQQPAAPSSPLWPPPGVAVPGNGITPPNLLQQVKPQYTYEAMRNGIQGIVVLGCVVEKDGSVSEDVRVIRSLDAGLDAAAIAAVRQWRFAPARTRDGSPVTVAIVLNLSFRIAGYPPPGPTLAWPAEFGSHVANKDVQGWVDETIDSAGLRIHLARPRDWVVQRFPDDDGRLVSVRNAFGTRMVTIRRPRTMPTLSAIVEPLPQARLDQFVSTLQKIEQAAGRKLEFRVYGQVMTSSTLWVWMDTHVSTSDLPADSMGTRLFSDVRMWVFATVIENQSVLADCMMLVPRDATDDQRRAQLEQTTAEFGSVMQHLSIGHR